VKLARRHFRNKKREYLKDGINELATNSKNKNIRDLCKRINEFKRGC
jgi:predicted NACHT family NTPase